MRFLILFLSTIMMASCAQDAASPQNAGGSTGQGGSLARFAIVGDYLYTLEVNALKWFKIESDGQMEPKGETMLPEGQETIFPLGELLFLGASDGLSIFQIEADGTPAMQSQIRHFAACDPVVANDSFAYVTLRVSSCAGLFRPEIAEDVLNIYDVQDVEDPTPLASYPMNDPRGLGLLGNVLFVCEGSNGLKVLDVSDPADVNTIGQLENIHANDVIVLEDALLVIGPEAIIQLDHTDPSALVILSTIAI